MSSEIKLKLTFKANHNNNNKKTIIVNRTNLKYEYLKKIIIHIYVVKYLEYAKI